MQKLKTTKQNDIIRNWHFFDANGKILGRIASEISVRLRGKAKPYYVAHLDCGDYVVVVNAKNIKVTGKKEKNKVYSRYSGYPGGLKREQYKDVLRDKPERIIYNAVSGMLPDNKLKSQLLTRLYIFSAADHPYKEKFTKKQ